MRRLTNITLLLALTAAATACGPDDDIAVMTRRQAVGEPTGSYPSYQERAVLYLTNRARVAPDDFNPDDHKEPSPPLAFDLELTKAARYHARHIVEQSCWCDDHSSCCELDREGDEAVCAGPVTGCGAMTPAARVGMWSRDYTSENMALGQRTPDEAVTGWIFSAGHWANMTNGSSTLLGAGYFPDAWVQDFGVGGTRPVVASGIHLPAGQSITFGATYFQPGTGGPRTALVIVDGECHELDLSHGEPESAAFETTIALESGCHRYYFHFTDGNGDDHTYPSTGSLGVGVAESDCEIYVDTRPADTCSPSGQTCITGDTRACYTGPFGTEGVGICEPGVQRCVGGQWDAECRLEVRPEEGDGCGDEIDNDCNGVVDDDCAPAEDGGAPDAGIMEDTGPIGSGSKDSEPGGCSTTGGAGPRLWLLAALALAAGRRTRRRK